MDWSWKHWISRQSCANEGSLQAVRKCEDSLVICAESQSFHMCPSILWKSSSCFFCSSVLQLLLITGLWVCRAGDSQIGEGWMLCIFLREGNCEETIWPKIMLYFQWNCLKGAGCDWECRARLSMDLWGLGDVLEEATFSSSVSDFRYGPPLDFWMHYFRGGTITAILSFCERRDDLSWKT